MTHDLQVIAPVDAVHPAVHGVAVALLELGRVVLRGRERTLARPAQFRKALDRLRLREGKGHILYFLFLPGGSAGEVILLRHCCSLFPLIVRKYHIRNDTFYHHSHCTIAQF